MAVNESDLERLRQQLEQERKNLQKQRYESEKNIEKMKSDMQNVRNSLIQSTRNTQNDMKKRMQVMEESIRTAYSKEIQKMKNSYEESFRNVQKLEDEYRLKLNQLEQEQKSILSEIQRKDMHRQALMRENAEKMQRAINYACQYPVEIFYPHRLQHYLDAGEEAHRLAKEGLFAESASLYDTVSMRIEDLVDDTKIKINELDMMFEIYKTVLARIENICTTDWELKDKNGDVILALTEETDMDYWSDMLYHVLLGEIAEHKRIIEGGSAEWVHQTHNNGYSPALMLDKQIRSLEVIPEQLEVCVQYALSACDSYNYIFTIRDTIVPVMAGQGYIYDGMKFGKRNSANKDTIGYQHYRQWLVSEECLYEGEEPDYREERCMQFINQEGNCCRIFIVPVRTGGTVGYRLYLDSQAEFQPEKVRLSLQRELQNSLPQVKVEIPENQFQLHTEQTRLMTKEVAVALTATPDENKLSAKYCMGI